MRMSGETLERMKPRDGSEKGPQTWRSFKGLDLRGFQVAVECWLEEVNQIVVAEEGLIPVDVLGVVPMERLGIQQCGDGPDDAARKVGRLDEALKLLDLFYRSTPAPHTRMNGPSTVSLNSLPNPYVFLPLLTEEKMRGPSLYALRTGHDERPAMYLPVFRR